jgi:hypothetical protein
MPRFGGVRTTPVKKILSVGTFANSSDNVNNTFLFLLGCSFSSADDALASEEELNLCFLLSHGIRTTELPTDLCRFAKSIDRRDILADSLLIVIINLNVFGSYMIVINPSCQTPFTYLQSFFVATPFSKTQTGTRRSFVVGNAFGQLSVRL